MSEATRCSYCGANLGPGDLDQPACPYCKTTHPHVAQARRQVEGLRQVFAEGGMQGMMGMAPPPGAPGQPHVPSPWQQHPGGSPVAFQSFHLPPSPRRTYPAVIFVALGLVVMLVGGIAFGVLALVL